MLMRSLGWSLVAFVGVAALTTVAAVVGDAQARWHPGLWILLASQGAVIHQIVVVARSGRAEPAGAGLVLCAALAGIFASQSLGWGEPAVSPVTAALLPVLALQCFQVIAIVLLPRLVWACAAGAVALLLSLALENPGLFVPTRSMVDSALMTTSVFLAAAMVVTTLRHNARHAATASAHRILLCTRAATTANARFADDEGRRIVHDRVIEALRVIHDSPPGPAIAQAASSALDALAELDPVTSADFLSDALESSGVKVVSDGSWRGASPPPRVMTALREAALEAIRNASRHGHASEVVVLITTSRLGQAAVVIRDDGDGFDPETVDGFGIRESIVGRLRQVGGDAAIDSSPGKGSTVSLLWPALDHPDGEQGSPILTSAQRRRLYLVGVTPSVLVGVFLGLHSLWGSRTPMFGFAMVVLVVVVTYAGVWSICAHPPSWGMALGVSAFNAGVAIEVLSNTVPGALADRTAWVVSSTAVLVYVVALNARLLQVAVLSLTQVAVVLAFGRMTDEVGPVEPLGSIVPTLGAATAAYVLGVLLRAQSRAAAMQEARSIALAVDQDALAIIQQARRRYADRLQVDVSPFLEQVAGHRIEVSPSVRARAAALSAQCRDILARADAIPSVIQDAVLEARLRGVTVNLRASQTTPNAAWELLLAVLARSAGLDAVTLIPARPDVPVRVATVPGLVDADVAIVRKQMLPVQVTATTSPVATAFELSPESATSRRAGQPIESIP